MADKLLKIIERYDSIVVFGHINPDGDCYGSQVGIKELILANYPTKRVYLTGRGQPQFFETLSKMDDVSDELIKKSLAIIVDCSNAERCEDQRCKDAAFQIKFDHHIEGNNPFKGPKILKTNKIAACEIIAEWAFKNKLIITEKAATALFLGIVTDSGRFMYDLANSRTFKNAAKLLDSGVDMPKLFDTLYQSSEDDLKLKKLIVSNYKTTENGVIYAIITQEGLKQTNIEHNKAAGSVNQLGNIPEYPIWATFTEYIDGKYRVELRSKTLPIQPLAVKYGGGGHANACGVTALDADELKSLINDLDALLGDK